MAGFPTCHHHRPRQPVGADQHAPPHREQRGVGRRHHQVPSQTMASSASSPAIRPRRMGRPCRRAAGGRCATPAAPGISGANIAAQPRCSWPTSALPALHPKCNEVAARGYEGFALSLRRPAAAAETRRRCRNPTREMTSSSAAPHRLHCSDRDKTNPSSSISSASRSWARWRSATAVLATVTGRPAPPALAMLRVWRLSHRALQWLTPGHADPHRQATSSSPHLLPGEDAREVRRA